MTRSESTRAIFGLTVFGNTPFLIPAEVAAAPTWENRIRISPMIGDRIL
ncbi:hypothetical protein FF011L_05460 [Roseimaritima multifibrata]|uniref:Uncharacterized protein n=1 Tax=Roseimaritima multifibrata TaxID=1930274 RepID=A0A517MAD8_9BACT|nr:hypothetical protein FF011L_05460 [Roseimaritima multifibrata]